MDEAYTLERTWVTRVVVEPGILGRLGSLIKNTRDTDSVLLFADSHVPREFVEEVLESFKEHGLPTYLEAVGGGEGLKSLEGLIRLLEGMMRSGLTRFSLAAGMGGGSVLDAVGFAAAVYMRGIGFMSLPTTLLAQADAGLGGKTGVNMAGKNLVGAFHPPLIVAIDPRVLRGLGERSYRQGFAELVKHGLIDGSSFLDLLSKHREELLERDVNALSRVLSESAHVKMGIVARDPWETRGLRLILNLGHTVGHAVEKASGYKLFHGEAVSIGLVAEAMLSVERGRAEWDLVEHVRSALEAFGLPTSTHLVDAAEAAQLIGLDKKRRGSTLHIPLPARPGEVVVEEVDVGWLRSWISTRLKGSVLA